jgi:hypothetical protein
LLEGLKDVEEALGERGINFVVGRGSPDEVVLSLGERISIILCDGGEYLRTEKEWRKSMAEGAFSRVVRVESNAVVPVEVASNNREHAARMLRPKIRGRPESLGHRRSVGEHEPRWGSLAAQHLYAGGTTAAKEKLEELVHSEQARPLRCQPQPAADQLRLAHEQVPSLRAYLARICSVEDPGGQRHAGRHRLVPRRDDRAPRALDIVSEIQNSLSYASTPCSLRTETNG